MCCRGGTHWLWGWVCSIEIFPLNYSKPGGCPNITHQLVYITDITSPTIQFYQGQTVINGSNVPVCFYFGGTDLQCDRPTFAVFPL